MSLYGSAMILLIIILRSLLKNRLPKSTFKVLWIIAAVRLLVPFFPVREISVPDKFSSPVTEYIVSEGQELPDVQYTGNTPANDRPAADISANKKVPLSKIIFAVWISGAAVTVSVFAASYFWGIKKYSSARTAYNSEISKIINGFSVRKNVRIMISSRIFSPLTYGIINPIILLPKNITEYDGEQIKYAVSHELMHIKNNDLLWKLLVICALCIHWFNPFVWIMLLLFSRDTELSCDEEVIRNGADRETYALTLISFKEKSSNTVFSNSFGKNAISERIGSIMKFKKTTTAAVIAAIAVISCTAAAFAIAPEIKITKEVTVSGSDIVTEQNSDNKSGTIIVNYSSSPSSDTDEAVQTEVNKSETIIYPEDNEGRILSHSDDDGIDVTFSFSGGNISPEQEQGEVNVTTVREEYYDYVFYPAENGLEIKLPPNANYGAIKHVPEEEYADGEDAVQVLTDMFSEYDSFTYPIDSMYNKLYHYDGPFYILAAKGENIYSMLDGTVIYADMHVPFGRAVVIDHGNGNVWLYAFCNDLCVSAGDEVKAGDIIAHVGSTGLTADNGLFIYRYQ